MSKITLLHYTPIEPIAKATAMPYRSKPTKGLVSRVFDSGHRSVVRHGMASFLIEGVSQSLLRQISRHPHINLTVKSSRYCDMGDTDIYTPIENIKKLEKVVEKAILLNSGDDVHIDLAREYNNDMSDVLDIYKRWKRMEGEVKDIDVAKLFLPLGSTMDLVVSGNYQALYEFLQLRICSRAEEEIRQIAIQLTKILKDILPEIFQSLDCRGAELGYCPEHKSCGRYPTKKELITSGE